MGVELKLTVTPEQISAFYLSPGTAGLRKRFLAAQADGSIHNPNLFGSPLFKIETALKCYHNFPRQLKVLPEGTYAGLSCSVDTATFTWPSLLKLLAMIAEGGIEAQPNRKMLEELPRAHAEQLNELTRHYTRLVTGYQQVKLAAGSGVNSHITREDTLVPFKLALQGTIMCVGIANRVYGTGNDAFISSIRQGTVPKARLADLVNGFMPE